MKTAIPYRASIHCQICEAIDTTPNYLLRYRGAYGRGG